jgi:hypothetical protein
MWSNNIADKLRITVVESKVSGSHPAAVLEKRGLAVVVSTTNVPTWVHLRYSVRNVSNSELQRGPLSSNVLGGTVFMAPPRLNLCCITEEQLHANNSQNRTENGPAAACVDR